jgi:hypothetical protein
MPNRDRVRMFNDIKNVPIGPARVTELFLAVGC